MPDKRSEKRSEQYRSLNNNASKKLADEIDRLNESKEKLSVEKVNMLLKLYAELGAELKKKYDNYPKDKDGNLDERVPEARMLKKINKRFSKDYAALLRYKNKTKKLEEYVAEEKKRFEEEDNIINTDSEPKKDQDIIIIDDETEDKKKKKFKNVEEVDKFYSDNTYTVEEFFDNARTRTLDISEDEMSELSSVGASSSTRLKINFIIDDEPIEGKKKGDACTGYFTPEKKATYTTKKSDFFKERHQMNLNSVCEKYPGAADCLKEIDSGFFYALKNTAFKGMLVGDLYRFGTDMTLKNTINSMKDAIDKFYKKSKSYNDIKEKLDEQFETIDTAEKAYAFIEMAGIMMKEVNVYELRDDSAINHFSDMAQRNALVSALADYFGCPEAVAYSEKMKIRTTKNGEKITIKGTMMMPGKGLDPSAPGMDNPVNMRDGFTYVDADKNDEEIKEASKSPKGLVKSVATLQFVDYLVGNTDRSTGNFFLQFNEKGKLVGVQGIDNDNSLGAIANCNETHCKFVALSDLRVIPKSMADAVKEVNTDVLTILMQGYGVNGNEIKATVKRIKDAQKKLARFEKIYEGTDPDYISPDVPRIVPDEEMDKYLINEQLATKKLDYAHENIFGKMVMESTINQGLKFALENTGKAVRSNAWGVASTYYGMINDVDTLSVCEIPEHEFLAETPKNTSFDVMKNAINEFKDICEEIPEMRVFESEKGKLSKKMDYCVYQKGDSFDKLKESTDKSIKAIDEYIENAKREMDSDALHGRENKLEEYESTKAEIKFYKDELAKAKEKMENNSKLLTEGFSTLSAEDMTKHVKAIEKSSGEIGKYERFLKESMAAKKTLEEDPSVASVLSAIRTKEKMQRFKEHLGKVEKYSGELLKIEEKLIEDTKRRRLNILDNKKDNSNNPYDGSAAKKQNDKKVDTINVNFNKSGNKKKFRVYDIDEIMEDAPKLSRNEIKANMVNKLFKPKISLIKK